MSRQEKLVIRFLTVPADLTWDELILILRGYGYQEIRLGKTSGSRRKFVDEEENIVILHKPHPANIVKKYVIKQLIENFKEKGKI
ncbi:MAG: type II toxin-antitoxin system HicA family toxin [Pedobacter sp.]|nr:type II toxin-antitoxin system HicA family toxin [Pedobacter sp.]